MAGILGNKEISLHGLYPTYMHTLAKEYFVLCIQLTRALSSSSSSVAAASTAVASSFHLCMLFQAKCVAKEYSSVCMQLGGGVF